MKKQISKTILFYTLLLTLVFNWSCSKKNSDPVTPGTVPTLSTVAITGISATGAMSGGLITAAGTAAITSRGVCWGTSTNPTIAGSKTSDGTGAGSYSSIITGLAAGTKYYVRAYATSSAGTGYGNVQEFTSTDGASNGAVEALLCGKNWKLTGLTVNGSDQLDALIGNCSKDDIIVFNLDGTLARDEKTVVCSPSGATTGTWSLNAAKTELTFTETGKSTQTGVVSVSETTLTITVSSAIATVISTFTKQ